MQISRTKNKKEKAKLRYSLDVLNTEYRAWEDGYSKCSNRDWPFCLSGEEYIIMDKIDSMPITPENILYKKLELPAMAENQNLSKLVVAGIGKDRYDDLGIHNWEVAMRYGISIPREKFNALIKD